MEATQPERFARKRRRLRRLAYLAVTTIAGLSGCSNENAIPHLATYPVKGRVLLADGKPLAMGRVFFRRKTEPPIQATGQIGSDGSFELTTFAEGDGAPEGEYGVRVDPVPESTTGPAPRIKLPNIPAKYTDREAEGFTVVVKAAPNELEPFRLK